MKVSKTQRVIDMRNNPRCSFRNQSYAVGSQCTLLTGALASPPNSPQVKSNWLGVPKIGLKKTIIKQEEVKNLLSPEKHPTDVKTSGSIVKSKNSFQKSFPGRKYNSSIMSGNKIKRSESNRSYHDHETDKVFRGMIQSPTAPANLSEAKLQSRFSEKDMSSLSSIQSKISDSDGVSLSSIDTGNYSSASDSDCAISRTNNPKSRVPGLRIFGGKTNNKRPIRSQQEKHPKLSVSTTHTFISVESSGSDQNINQDSNETSTSRVSTPDVLNDFDLEDALLDENSPTHILPENQRNNTSSDTTATLPHDALISCSIDSSNTSKLQPSSMDCKDRGRNLSNTKLSSREKRDTSPSVLLKGQHLVAFGNENKV